jgi:hypothetical protein
MGSPNILGFSNREEGFVTYSILFNHSSISNVYL